jgi:type 1 fimbriae regulatory protein FimB/type 1 fimbriae regulatory protein FimE
LARAGSRQSRRTCALTNAGHDTRALQDYLGHPKIQHTMRYSELAPGLETTAPYRSGR